MSEPHEPVDEQAATLPWDPEAGVAPTDDPGPQNDNPTDSPPASSSGRGKVWVAAVLLIAAGALTWLVIGGVEQNLVYYLTPSELLAKGEEGIGASVRLGGMVQKGSINWQPESTTLAFVVRDHGAEIPVKASAIPPEMFREGIGVIVEGSLQPGGVFTTSRLMVRHSNEYKAPGDNETVDIDYMSQTLDDEGS